MINNKTPLVLKDGTGTRPWTSTYTGKRFYYDEIDPDSIDIEDVAHALSRQCRFNGHLNGFFSTAQHSVEMVPFFNHRLERRLALLHDIAETWLGDLVSPFKRSLGGMYEAFEEPIHEVAFKKFGILDTYHNCWSEIMDVDRRLLYEDAVRWGVSLPGDGFVPEGFESVLTREQWSCDKAEEMFLKAFYDTF